MVWLFKSYILMFIRNKWVFDKDFNFVNEGFWSIKLSCLGCLWLEVNMLWWVVRDGFIYSL